MLRASTIRALNWQMRRNFAFPKAITVRSRNGNARQRWTLRLRRAFPQSSGFRLRKLSPWMRQVTDGR